MFSTFEDVENEAAYLDMLELLLDDVVDGDINAVLARRLRASVDRRDMVAFEIKPLRGRQKTKKSLRCKE